MLDFGKPNAFGQAGGGQKSGQDSSQGPSLASPPNSTGGKGIIKFNPTPEEITRGIRAQTTLFSWQSPDGQPHYVTIDFGRMANGFGAPASNGSIQPGLGGGGAGQFPQPNTGTITSFLSYRATAQITLGTPGTMQDVFYLDIGRGQRFSALASYVAFTAEAEPPPAGLFSGVVTYVAGALGVYATLGIGFAPSLAPLVFTQYIDVLNPGTGNAGAAFTLPIPPKANYILGLQSSNKSDTMRLLFEDIGGRVIASTNSFANGTLIVPIPLAEDYDAVIVRNEGGVDANYRLLYQISV
jgi:hypothetical protein